LRTPGVSQSCWPPLSLPMMSSLLALTKWEWLEIEKCLSMVAAPTINWQVRSKRRSAIHFCPLGTCRPIQQQQQQNENEKKGEIFVIRRGRWKHGNPPPLGIYMFLKESHGRLCKYYTRFCFCLDTCRPRLLKSTGERRYKRSIFYQFGCVVLTAVL
jgi:hypothetical protein